MNTEVNVRQGKKKIRLIIVLTSVILTLAIISGACAVYLCDYYRADGDMIATFAPMNEVKFKTLENGSIIFTPQEPIAGLIFYPGGKVENDAYKPLMASLASRGIMCVLVEMPFNLAVFDINAADGIREQYHQIEKWYIGGHSLGGSMAAAYLEKNIEDFDGLILLGSYSTADLSGTDLEVLSVYGSEDKVMNREKYDENKANLPSDFEEVVIEGGCHAYFGMYREQDGDGTPTISHEKQIEMTANAISEMLK
jgi:dienelactone hydrolase